MRQGKYQKYDVEQARKEGYRQGSKDILAKLRVWLTIEERRAIERRSY